MHNVLLKVYDGPSTSSRMINKLCGDTTPAPIRSSRDSVLVKLRTDDGQQGRGFKVKYWQSKYKCQQQRTPSRPQTQKNNPDNDYQWFEPWKLVLSSCVKTAESLEGKSTYVLNPISSVKHLVNQETQHRFYYAEMAVVQLQVTQCSKTVEFSLMPHVTIP